MRRAVALLVWLPFAAAPGRAQQPGDTLVVPIPGTDVRLSMAHVPGGAFRIGSPPAEAGRDADEGPPRAVLLEPFWMGVHEVTHDQFAPFRYRRLDGPAVADAAIPFDADAVARPSPPYEDPVHGMGMGDRPAGGMTRLAALHYARWLSLKTGRLFRLPTEAEWEYACRAGVPGPYGLDAGADLGAYAWYEANSQGAFHPVGRKAPNAWGLRDMHGNVAEWVMDGYDADAYAALPEDAPAHAPLAGHPARGRGVVRGGAFDDPAAELRCAARYPESAAWKRRDPQIPRSSWWNTDAPQVGFRLVSPARPYTPDEIEAYWAELLGG